MGSLSSPFLESDRIPTLLRSGSSAEGREKKASGVEELRLALRRLSLRRQNNLSERRFFEEERDRRQGGHGVPDALHHQSAMTPSESIMSLGNIHLWASRGPYLPDKLQIVKPLEGEGERKAGVGWRRWDAERYRGAGTKKVSKRGWGAESERKRESRRWRAPEGEREKGWGWARKTVAGMERERGRRWARDRAGSRKVSGGRDKRDAPLSLMLFSSFWSLMHHHKSGSFTSPHSCYRASQPRGWL